MLNKKSIVLGLATLCISGFSQLMYAQCLHPNDLQITNLTPFVSTAKIIGPSGQALCTGIAFQEAGKTRPGQSKCFDQVFMSISCKDTPERCVAFVYLYDEANHQPLCHESTKVAKVIFSLTEGIKPENIYNNTNSEYEIVGNGFQMAIVHK